MYQTIETIVRGDAPDSPDHYLPRLAADYSEKKPTFLKKAAEYALIFTLTIGGAYAGFSASRYTALAESLRLMERDPIINAYSIKHDLESYQELKKWDIFSPDQAQANRDKELINTIQGGAEGFANGAISAAKGIVGLIPWVGGIGTYLIEQKQQEEQQKIRAY